MQLELWQIIAAIIGTGGLSSLFAAWVQRERIRTEAKNATTERWKELADGLVRRIDAQERLVKRQEERIAGLDRTIARQDKRIETQDVIIQLQQKEIEALHRENATLKEELAHERQRRQVIEQKMKVAGDSPEESNDG